MRHGKQTMGAFSALVLAAILAACSSLRESVVTPTVDGGRPIEPVQLDGTDWVLTSLNGNSPVEGSTVTVGFFPENYMEGEAGCNSYGAEYVISGSEFQISEIHRTHFDCDVAQSILQQEKVFFEALTSTAAYRGTDERLEFDNAAGETIVAFARKLPPPVDPALKDTEWLLTSLNGSSPLEDSHITLNFAMEGFDGYAGCNSVGGAYEAADAGIFSTAEVWQTAMECPTPAITDQEQAYVEALRNATAYRVIGDRLEIDNAAGETTLVFRRKEESSMDPADLLGTAWRLASLNGSSLVEGSTITLAIHNEHQVSGQAGCRDYVAGYGASGDDIGFTFLAMIEADCTLEDALLEQEGVYTTILGWATDYRLHEAQLEILTERGEVLTFDRLPMDHEASLEAAPWTLTAFVEDKVVEEMPVPLPMPTDRLADTEITATFEDGTVSGSAGCNTYRAAYAADGSSITLETLAATEMSCTAPAGIMEQEQRYLRFLGDVVTYRVHDNQLWLETGDGRALVFASYSQER